MNQELDQNAETTDTVDIWIAGTEEPQFSETEYSPTDEGAQEISDHESEARLDEQFGRVVTDDYVFDDEMGDDERMIVNMGPQHPSTHGVLRLQLELEGEIIRRTKPIIGYLHTGMEKTAEQLTFGQGPTNVTRMDYLAPLHCELAYSLAVERLLGVEIPERAQAIRVLMTELNRASSHLVALATNGMDIGAVSMMIYGFRERESILAFFEKTTGLRMNHNYIRPGGVAADLPPGWKDDVAAILKDLPYRLQQYDDLLENNPIWLSRTISTASHSRWARVTTSRPCRSTA
jgi:NADH-quinone oxidoreductase subunit D